MIPFSKHSPPRILLGRIGSCLFLKGCLIGLISCTGLNPKPEPGKGEIGGNHGGTPKFRVHQPQYDQASPSETTIAVSLSDQKARLFDKDGQVILETQVSTGIPDHPTPAGKFKVLVKKVEKRSNLYGRYVHKETGEIVISQSWTHEGPKPEGTIYRGIAMPYWMRLTWHGVGMHVGDFPAGHRSSHGCIRVPTNVQPLIYAKTQVGTPVDITQ